MPGALAIRNFAVFSTQQNPIGSSKANATLEGVAVDCRIVETPDPIFDSGSPAHRNQVLVRKHAFSLNYRDRAYILGPIRRRACAARLRASEATVSI